PAAAPRVADCERPRHLLCLSARSEPALKALATRYQKHLESHADVPAGDVCYTANAGRSHFAYRLALTGESGTGLAERLAAWSDGTSNGSVQSGKVPATEKNDVVFLFTGQGSQYVGMGRELYETQPTFRRTLTRCDEILRGILERPLLEVMFGAPGSEEEKLLHQTAYTQPALFALEYGLAQLFR